MDLKIQRTILEMDETFSLSELYTRLAEQGITDKKTILNVLDELLNWGLVEFSDDTDESTVSYQSVFAIA